MPVLVLMLVPNFVFCPFINGFYPFIKRHFYVPVCNGQFWLVPICKQAPTIFLWCSWLEPISSVLALTHNLLDSAVIYLLQLRWKHKSKHCTPLHHCTVLHHRLLAVPHATSHCTGTLMHPPPTPTHHALHPLPREQRRYQFINGQ